MGQKARASNRLRQNPGRYLNLDLLIVDDMGLNRL